MLATRITCSALRVSAVGISSLEKSCRGQPCSDHRAWRDYQQHINARMQYADPDGDAKLRNADEVEQEAAEWQQKAERVHNEWYNQRKRRPQEFGV